LINDGSIVGIKKMVNVQGVSGRITKNTLQCSFRQYVHQTLFCAIPWI